MGGSESRMLRSPRFVKVSKTKARIELRPWPLAELVTHRVMATRTVELHWEFSFSPRVQKKIRKFILSQSISCATFVVYGVEYWH
jgi:hypothetical protein